ncbi:hypothetical protein AHAS_Ahas19G0147800 [Arachis hypogaea]
MLSQSPSISNPSHSASRFSKECFGGANRRCRVVVPRIPVWNSNFARKRRETLLSRQRIWNWIGTITIEQIGFMNILAFQRNRLRERVLFLESRHQNRAMVRMRMMNNYIVMIVLLLTHWFL